ncbi:MAG: hypothetical protein WCO84_02265 [bacterium]
MKKNKGNSLIIFVILFVVFILPGIYRERNLTNNNKNATSTAQNTGTSSLVKIEKIEREKNIEPKTEINTATQSTTTKNETVKTIPVVVKDPNESILHDKLKIGYVYGNSSEPKYESINIRNNDQKESINITGLKLETSLGKFYVIPNGYNLPGFSTTPEDDIILSPNMEATIFVGTQERKMNFRENICTGYFDETSNYGGVLYHSCPRIEVSKMLNFSDQCLSTLESISSCRMFDTKLLVDSECSKFITEHYSYTGCVKDFKNRADFYSKRWLVWMQRSAELFRNGHELIKLKDLEGKIIDEYSY